MTNPTKTDGPIVFIATSEMAEQTGKALKSGETYVAQRASRVSPQIESTESTHQPAPRRTRVLRSSKDQKLNRHRRTNRPRAVINYIKEHPGSLMTEIEQGTQMNQADIRRVLNDARETGIVSTTGKRRGLRYHPGPALVENGVVETSAVNGD